jgi:branched-subunit amino acid aminotransferase/4-amino-4-deoxychorismate lyase
MRSWLWNGSSFESTNSIPITDRGFRYGMSIFESMCVRAGAIEFWPQHTQRLITSCIERDFIVPDSTFAAAGEHLTNSGLSGFARIYVTAGDGPLTAPVNAPRVFIFIEEREAEREESWALCFHDDFYRAPFAGLKTANYWFNADALASARARSFDEAVLCNDFGELVSACCANIFLVKDDRILTPSRSSGCRAGVVREWVINRRKVEERRLRREDAITADEIFLTNSWIGVMPVDTLEGRPLGPRSIGNKLAAEFQQRREEAP